MTLVLSGSPDATPSGKNCRASRQPLRDIAGAFAKATVAPRAAAVANSARREIFVMDTTREKLAKATRRKQGTTPRLRELFRCL
jgi:hypothetical protein